MKFFFISKKLFFLFFISILQQKHLPSSLTAPSMSESHTNVSSAVKRKASAMVAWSCCVCMNVCGEDAGVVPMASTGCALVSHMVCLSCFLQLPRNKALLGVETVNCPACRAPTSFKILLEIVNASGDQEAIDACTAYQVAMRAPVLSASRKDIRNSDDDELSSDEYNATTNELRARPPASERRPLAREATSSRSAVPMHINIRSTSDDLLASLARLTKPMPTREELKARRLKMARQSITHALNNWPEDESELVVSYKQVPAWDYWQVSTLVFEDGICSEQNRQNQWNLTHMAKDLLPDLKSIFPQLLITVPPTPFRPGPQSDGLPRYLLFLIRKRY